MKLYKNICLVDTPYALSIYLLKMSMEDIHRTMFFVGDSVNVKIARELPHYALLRNQTAKNDWKYMSWLRFYKYIKCLSFPFAKLYVQDHLYIASQIIGPFKYVNLPDGPDYYVAWEGSAYPPYKYRPTTIKQKIKHILSHGPMYDLKCGMNEQCTNRWITTREEEKSSYLKGRNYEYVDAAKLWESADNEKRAYIMKVFGISDEFINQGMNAEALILSQPLREDCLLTDEEMAEIYAPYVKKYPNIAVKTHPRDKFDWKQHFPSVHVIETYAPMQLLSYMGFNPSIAITVCSTAISAMPETTKKILIGTNIHDKILHTYGDLCNH